MPFSCMNFGSFKGCSAKTIPQLPDVTCRYKACWRPKQRPNESGMNNGSKQMDDGSKPCTPGEHQNSWDLWMFIPLKMVLIGIDPFPNGWWCLFGRQPPSPAKCWGVPRHFQTTVERQNSLEDFTKSDDWSAPKLTYLSCETLMTEEAMKYWNDQPILVPIGCRWMCHHQLILIFGWESLLGSRVELTSCVFASTASAFRGVCFRYCKDNVETVL